MTVVLSRVTVARWFGILMTVGYSENGQCKKLGHEGTECFNVVRLIFVANLA